MSVTRHRAIVAGLEWIMKRMITVIRNGASVLRVRIMKAIDTRIKLTASSVHGNVKHITHPLIPVIGKNSCSKLIHLNE